MKVSLPSWLSGKSEIGHAVPCTGESKIEHIALNAIWVLTNAEKVLDVHCPNFVM